MVIDLTKLCEDELIELNQRIVERLQLITLGQEPHPTRQALGWDGCGVRYG
jgi:hypothetical protein